MYKMPFDESIIYIEPTDMDGDYMNVFDGDGVVMIQKPGCPPCEQTKPEFQAFAREIAGGDVQAYTYEYAGGNDVELIGKAVPGFRGFPTIIKIHDGHYVGTHNGARTADAMKEFISATVKDPNEPPRSVGRGTRR